MVVARSAAVDSVNSAKQIVRDVAAAARDVVDAGAVVRTRHRRRQRRQCYMRIVSVALVSTPAISSAFRQLRLELTELN